METKKLFLFVIIVFFLTSFITSSSSDKRESLGIFEKGNDIELIQLCSDGANLCASCNISSIKYPNSTIIISDQEMTKRVADFNYTLISNYTQTTGEYKVNGVCTSGADTQVWNYYFEVTNNGNETPEGVVIVLFVLLFILITVGLLGLLLYNIFHMIQWDFDAKDLIFNVSAYFGLFVTYILGKTYLGNEFFDSFLIWVIGVTALTNVILPLIAFLMSYMRGGLEGNE